MEIISPAPAEKAAEMALPIPIPTAPQTLAMGGSSSSTGGSSSSNGSSNSNSNGYGDSSSDRISQEKAESIVLAKIPGATIIKLKLEKDDGRYVYEGEAILGDYEYEFEIDANSGVIIDWEKEWYDEWDD